MSEEVVKVVAWPYEDQPKNPRNRWWVVRTSPVDGSYFPLSGPHERKDDAEEILRKMVVSR